MKALVLLLVAACSTACVVHAATEIASPVIEGDPPAVVPAAPPPAVAEVSPEPAAGHVWVPGYWWWGPSGYVWIPGRQVAARPGVVWIGPRHVFREGVHYYYPAGWFTLR